MSVNVSERSMVMVSKNQVSTDLDGREVILDLKAGKYYGLDGVGARIWSLIQEPSSVAQVCDTLTSEYDVSRDCCLKDILALLSELEDAQLIDVTDVQDQKP